MQRICSATGSRGYRSRLRTEAWWPPVLAPSRGAPVIGATLALFATHAGAARAQRVEAPAVVGTDTVEVVANPAYAAGSLQRTLLGEEYRDLWAAPIRVPLLDLSRFSGGLQPTEAGGRKQTKSLRFVDPEGREFVFRSVDKDPQLAHTPDLEDTYAGWLVRDQTSALFPAAAVALPPLMQAAGIIHVVPRLAVMPDDPRLGEYREEFAGMLGMIEERPDEGDDGQLDVAGSPRIIGTERLRERLLDGPDDLIDGRAMLTARLIDGVINDRDRHWDQWRWAQVDSAGRRYWRPIPEDRDYAFVDFDGVLISAARLAASHFIPFSSDFPSATALSYNAFDMDRRLLAELDWADWERVVKHLEAALTDEVFAAVVDRLPVEYREIVGDELQNRLRQRRENLREFAHEWYGWLSTHVDVHGTDEAELARADHLGDGTLRVRLFARGDEDLTDTVGRGTPVEPAAPPFFERRFLPGETREVRIYLHGDADRAVVSGPAGPGAIRVRVIGGEGGDVLSDSTTADRSAVAFHDADPEGNRFHLRRGTRVDTRPFTPPEAEDPISGATYRDFGSSDGISGAVSYGGTRGLEVAVTRSWSRRGFRYVPHEYEIELTGGYSVRLNAVGLDLEAEWRRRSSANGISLLARATQLEPFRFFGFGNDTPPRPDDDPYIVERDLLSVQPSLDYRFAPSGRISLGPVAKYSKLRPREGSAVLLGDADRTFVQLGGWGEAEIDLRDRPALPRAGVLVRFGASAYGGAWDADAPFGRFEGSVSTYLSTPAPRGPTLAVRAGGSHAWGEYPVHEAARVGGWRTLRGYDTDRFAGDAAVWGAAEARIFIARPNLLVVRGDLGALAFVDAGRVYFDGGSRGGWHRGIGGGLYLLVDFHGMPIVGSLLYARGETDKLRIQFGAPF